MDPVTELARERALNDELFREIRGLATTVRHGPAAEEAKHWAKIEKLFRESGRVQ